MEGTYVGVNDGDTVRIVLGHAEGSRVGTPDGAVGIAIGFTDKENDGDSVGTLEGTEDSFADGALVETILSLTVGDADGS